MPTVSPAQHRLMEAAAHTPGGYGGVPQKVGKEFVAKDMNRADWSILKRLISRWLSEEEEEPEHKGEDVAALAPNAGVPAGARKAEDESEEEKKRNEGKLSEQQRAEIGRVGGKTREADPADIFLEPASQKYPVKDKTDGEWKYSRRLLLAAAREARMHGHEDIASRADAIRAREFGGASDMALDRGSARTYDADGRLHLDRSNISKANICEYLGREIPNHDQLGLDAERRYRLLRHPDELKKAVDSFNNLPILSRHVAVSADQHHPGLVVGSTGTDAAFDGPYLTNSLVFWARDAIADIENGDQRELSCAYRYTPDMTPGTYEGAPYDGVMRDIVGNHVALVREGRAGPDVMVGDAKGEKMTTFADIKKRLRASLPRNPSVADVLYALDAMEEACDAETEEEKKALEKANAAKDRKRAHDAEEEERRKDEEAEDMRRQVRAHDARRKLGRDETDEEEEEREKKESAEDARNRLGRDESEEEREKREAEDKKARDSRRAARDAKHAKDEPPAFKGKPEVGKGPAEDTVTKAAMDAAIEKTRREAVADTLRIQREIREAERIVRPLVGELTIALDSAEMVYRTALEMRGVKTAGLHPSAFRAMVEMLPKTGGEKHSGVAMDAAGAKSFAERYPDAARIVVM